MTRPEGTGPSAGSKESPPSAPGSATSPSPGGGPGGGDATPPGSTTSDSVSGSGCTANEPSSILPVNFDLLLLSDLELLFLGLDVDDLPAPFLFCLLSDLSLFDLVFVDELDIPKRRCG
jgi:hypothetical protein